MRKNILVLGATGFIGTNLCAKLKKEGHFVIGADIKGNDFDYTPAHEYYYGDLSDKRFMERCFSVYQFDEIYQLAALMGGAGFIFTGDNDANIMSNSAAVNINLCEYLSKINYTGKVFYSSSACIYPEHAQTDYNNTGLSEHDAYPANPDSNYGWEKLFSERLYMAYAKNYGLDVRIARFHNIFGEYSTYKGGKEKAPAAMCRKVAEAIKELDEWEETNDCDSITNDDCNCIQIQEELSTIEVWGSGKQTRSFLYIDECLEGIERLMNSDYKQPVNIGSSELISINDLAKMVIEISGKDLTVKNVESNAIGVLGRNSDNTLIEKGLGWKPSKPLKEGMIKLYSWVEKQISV